MPGAPPPASLASCVDNVRESVRALPDDAKYSEARAEAAALRPRAAAGQKARLERLAALLEAAGAVLPQAHVCGICHDVLAEHDEDGFQRLPCRHGFHVACLRRMAEAGNRHVPENFASVHAWDAYLRCPQCKDPLPRGLPWLPLGPMLEQRRRLERLERQHVAVEYSDEEERRAALRAMRGQTHFHFCGACRQPQLLLTSASCQQQAEGETQRVDPCPHCHPEHYQVRCPACGARLWRSGGCRSMRCCPYGEKCGLDRKKTVTVRLGGVDMPMEVPDPQPCDHGGHGCCGAAFALQPRASTVDSRLDQTAFDRFLQRLHPGSGCLLLQHLTRHDLTCVTDGCPACLHAHQLQPSPFIEHELRQNQYLLQFVALQRRQRRLQHDQAQLDRALTADAEDGEDSATEEEDEQDSAADAEDAS